MDKLTKIDGESALSFFRREVNKFVQQRGWKKYHTPKNLVQAIHCEAGELSQLLLFKEYSKEAILNDKKLFENVSDEIADVFIYLISLVNVLDLDLKRAFQEKMNKNNQKYPVEEFNEGKYYKK